MKILIATSIYPPQVGGPAHYSFKLKEEFEKMGHKVVVVSYTWEKALPSGIKHIIYLIKLLFALERG